VNGNLLAAAAALTPDQLRAEFPIGQGSVWKSLVHLYAAEFVWLEALLGTEAFVVPGDLPGKLPGNQQGDGGVADFADLRLKWAGLEHRWADHLAGLTPADLDQVVYRKSASLGTRLALRRGDVLAHVCTHAQYTAAQVVNMLRQAGADRFPETMLISLVRHETA
jgi:uncharacterized damage-inducible protein DinB